MIPDTVLTSIATVCQQVAHLLRRRRKRLCEFFQLHVQPLFQHLVTVHEDYTQGLFDLLVTIESCPGDDLVTEESVVQQKRQLEQLSFLIRKLSNAIIASPLARIPDRRQSDRAGELVFEFAWSVRDYFRKSLGDPQPLDHGMTYTRDCLSSAIAFTTAQCPARKLFVKEC